MVTTRKTDAGLRGAFVLLVLILAGGCSSIGPTTIPRDQFDYNAAVATSMQEQLLLNLVRLRYSEAPVFLRVSSVISQYQRTASTSALFSTNTGLAGQDSATAGAGYTWSDRPTITYTPVSGREFSQNLLTPIPPEALFEKMLSGWPAKLVLRVGIWSINGIDNDIARPALRRSADKEMLELFEIWRRLRDAGAVGMRKLPADKGGSTMVLLLHDKNASAEVARDIARFFDMLGLDPAAGEYPLRFGLIPQHPNEITVLSGSIWDIMLNLAWQFDVPAEHIISGRTGETFRVDHFDGKPPIQVSFSTTKPEAAFIAVKAHDYWFYIKQQDWQSKLVFSFLQLMLNLAETSAPSQGPVLTISN